MVQASKLGVDDDGKEQRDEHAVPCTLDNTREYVY
jgi:hypothetical protein